MKEIISYLVSNADNLLAVATTIVAAASAISALTPTPKDDAVASKAYKVLEQFAFLNNKAKQ